MKNFLLSTILFLISFLAFPQAPKLDYYSQFGFNAGYAHGKVKSAPTLGIIHSTIIGRYWFYEASGVRMAFFNEKSQKSKITMLELMTMDMGFGYTSDNFFIGISPFSINLTQSPNFGLAVLSKCRILDKYVVETKLEPFVYGKPKEYGLFNSNFYVGMHYWFSDYFSIGLRYNRYDYYDNLNILFSWNFL